MALEQEVDGPGQAESGKEKKQNKVHRFLAYGPWRSTSIRKKPAG
jgi:hypothetical protein